MGLPGIHVRPYATMQMDKSLTPAVSRWEYELGREGATSAQQEATQYPSATASVQLNKRSQAQGVVQV